VRVRELLEQALREREGARPRGRVARAQGRERGTVGRAGLACGERGLEPAAAIVRHADPEDVAGATREPVADLRELQRVVEVVLEPEHHRHVLRMTGEPQIAFEQ